MNSNLHLLNTEWSYNVSWVSLICSKTCSGIALKDDRCHHWYTHEQDTYSMGNQSPQSSLTLSMSLWQRKRSWTSLRAVGGTTSLIQTCRDRQKAQIGLVSLANILREKVEQCLSRQYTPTDQH